MRTDILLLSGIEFIYRPALASVFKVLFIIYQIVNYNVVNL